MKNEYLSENRVSLPEIRIRMLDKTLNIRGTLLSLATPVVMGILNGYRLFFRKADELSISADILPVPMPQKFLPKKKWNGWLLP